MELRLSSPKIWIFNQAVDFRKAIDGMTELACQQVDANVHEDVFIFYNRLRDKIKVLAWHGNGFVLLYKRLERGRFYFSRENSNCLLINDNQLSWLLAGLNWIDMSSWKTLKYEDFY